MTMVDPKSIIELTLEVNRGDCLIVIHYRTNKLQRVCENAEVAAREYGVEMAERIQLRIDQISSADNVEQLVQYHIGRCHSLQGNRKGQYAMDLTHPYRLIFEKINNNSVEVRIEEIVDYH